MASLLRILADFGDAAGWLVAAVTVFYFARHVVRENDKAHAALAESIEANAVAIAALRADLHAIATDLRRDASDLRGEVHAIAAGLRRDAADLRREVHAIATDLRHDVHAIVTDLAILRDRAAESGTAEPAPPGAAQGD